MTWQISLRSIIQQAAYGLEKLSQKNKGFLHWLFLFLSAKAELNN